VPLTLDVTEGPRREAGCAGSQIFRRRFEEAFANYQEGAVDVDLLEEGRKNLRERFGAARLFRCDGGLRQQTQDVKEKGKNGWQGTEEVITYTANRGERHKLIGIEISGNKYFNAELLRGD